MKIKINPKSLSLLYRIEKYKYELKNLERGPKNITNAM